MRLWSIAAVCAAVIGLVATSPAEATKKKRVVRSDDSMFLRDYSSRPQLTVRRRSFLDAGTEVLPGERKFMDYAAPPFSSPLDVLTPGYDNRQLPLPNEMGIYTVGPLGVW